MSMVSAFPMCNSQLGLYSSASSVAAQQQPSCRRQELKLQLAEEYCMNEEQAKKLSVTSTSSTASSSSMGGLRRTVSSLQAVKQCLLNNTKTNNCIVEARQVELFLTTQTERPFFLRIRAPNGEFSERFAFPFGKSARFSPQLKGCGHGEWTFELEPIEAEQESKKTDSPKLIQRSISLDGVGSLYFTIDNELNIRLNAQEFLRLPSASQCCSRNSQQANRG